MSEWAKVVTDPLGLAGFEGGARHGAPPPIAQAFEKLGRKTEASEEFDKAYRLDPQLKSQPK